METFGGEKLKFYLATKTLLHLKYYDDKDNIREQIYIRFTLHPQRVL